MNIFEICPLFLVNELKNAQWFLQFNLRINRFIMHPTTDDSLSQQQRSPFLYITLFFYKGNSSNKWRSSKSSSKSGV
uniref:Uncharacterized protein n=1 Tax=Picea sitchensis TaxID=3332 RepID=A0A6B9XSX5_PICSI|nr:hypothetical protein Q903MT_gene6623 [Picea sitchensis]